MPDYRRLRRPRYITRTSEIDSVDVDFNFEGDFTIGEYLGGNTVLSEMQKDELVSMEGDIKVVGNKFGSVGRNIVLKRLNSRSGDWIFDPNCGANIEDFYGATLNKSTMDMLQNQIFQALTYDGFILANNLFIEILPMTVNEIKIIIMIRNPANENFQLITTSFSASENRFNRFT